MTDTANAPEQGNMPDIIMAWPDFDGCVTGSWSANQYSDERARKYVLATLDGGQIEEPTEPGSFVGDIWFGDQIKRTRGTHRWDGAAWQSLPTETEVLIELLAKERAKIARLTEALKWYGEQARLCRLIHSEGDAGRNALSNDGGKRAIEALQENG